MAVPDTGRAHLRAHSHPGARPIAFLEVALALTRVREMYARRACVSLPSNISGNVRRRRKCQECIPHARARGAKKPRLSLRFSTRVRVVRDPDNEYVSHVQRVGFRGGAARRPDFRFTAGPRRACCGRVARAIRQL